MINKYLRLASVLLAMSTLTACANKPFEPVPEGYTGPVADITDTIDNRQVPLRTCMWFIRWIISLWRTVLLRH